MGGWRVGAAPLIAVSIVESFGGRDENLCFFQHTKKRITHQKKRIINKFFNHLLLKITIFTKYDFIFPTVAACALNEKKYIIKKIMYN